VIERILVPTDFSEHSALALRHACELARLCGAELRLLTSAYLSPVWVAERAAPIPEEYRQAVRKQAEHDLEVLARTLRELGLRVSSSVSSDHPVSAIRSLAESWPADLIAMGTHGRTGISHALLGSTAERTVRSAACAVLTVRGDAGEPRPIRRILAATDFSVDANHALVWAVELARRSEARISLVHALAGPVALGEEELPLESVRAAQWAAEQAAHSRLERLVAQHPEVAGDPVLEPGKPWRVICDASRRLEADLIVLGSRGRSGLGPLLLGSTAERVVRHAPRPVVVLKAPSRA
jgi:nucleotide-binding universal stress UspA family protein